MRPFIAELMRGLSVGVPVGYKIGADIADRRAERENDRAKLARDAARDAATAEYRGGMLGVAQGRLGVSQAGAAETKRANKAREGTAARGAKSREDMVDIARSKQGGIPAEVSANNPPVGAVGTQPNAGTGPSTTSAVGDFGGLNVPAEVIAKVVMDEDDFIPVEAFGGAGDE